MNELDYNAEYLFFKTKTSFFDASYFLPLRKKSMAKVMVKMIRSSECLKKHPNLNVKEEQRFSELFHEKIISEMHLSKDKKNIWIILSLNNIEEVKEIIKSIPLHLNEEAEICELI
jgi:hypothetical protein